MSMSRLLSGPSAGPRQPGQPGPARRTVAPLGLDSPAPVCPEAVTREASSGPWAVRSRGRAAFDAVARWLRRALADAARAWALAAGVPPDLYD